MKNVLFATTALVLTAGVASAEVTFSGKAEAGVIKTGKVAAVTASAGYAAALTAAQNAEAAYYAAPSATTKKAWDTAAAALAKETAPAAAKGAAESYTTYSGIDIDIAASVATDMGATVSVSADIGGGKIADVADKELDDQGETIAAPAVKITSNGTTITIQNDGIDDYYDGDLKDYDVGVSGAVAGLSYGIAFNTEKASVSGSAYTATATYAAGPMSVSVSTNDVDGGDDQMKASVSYAMGAVTATVTTDNKGAAATINSVKIAYAQDGVTASISFADDKDHAGNTNKNGDASWDLAVGYTMGAMGLNFSTNESEKWEADVSYDLGGATAFAATDSNETMMAGINFKF
jgi:outer membrane protein OmpU